MKPVVAAGVAPLWGQNGAEVAEVRAAGPARASLVPIHPTKLGFATTDTVLFFLILFLFLLCLPLLSSISFFFFFPLMYSQSCPPPYTKYPQLTPHLPQHP